MFQLSDVVGSCDAGCGGADADASETNTVAVSDINSVPGEASAGAPVAEQSPTRPATDATDVDEQLPRRGAQQQRPTDDAFLKARALRPITPITKYIQSVIIRAIPIHADASLEGVAFASDATFQTAAEISTGSSSGEGGGADAIREDAADENAWASKTANEIGCRPVCSEQARGDSERPEDNGIALDAGGPGAVSASQRYTWHAKHFRQFEMTHQELQHQLQRMKWLRLLGKQWVIPPDQVVSSSSKPVEGSSPREARLLYKEKRYQYWPQGTPVPKEKLMIAEQCAQKGIHRVAEYFIDEVEKEKLGRPLEQWMWLARLGKRGMSGLSELRFREDNHFTFWEGRRRKSIEAQVMCNTCNNMQVVTTKYKGFVPQDELNLLYFFKGAKSF